MVEHLAANTATILTSDISMDEKNTFFTFAKDAVLKQAQDVEHDSRYQLMAGSFLSTTGQLDESLVYLNRAHELIPGKQQVYFEIGATYINKQEPQQALKVFKEAYDLAPAYAESRITYLVGAIYAGSRSTENELLNLSTEKEIVFDDRIINAYYALGRIDRVINLLKERIRLDPKHTDTYQKYLETIVNR
jgi:tetratricopeptide (TPR) repeat protein